MTVFSHRAIARIFFVLCVGSATVSLFGDDAMILTGSRVSKREAARVARNDAKKKKKAAALARRAQARKVKLTFKERWRRLRGPGKVAVAIAGAVLGAAVVVIAGAVIWAAVLAGTMTGCPCFFLGPLMIGACGLYGLLLSTPLLATSGIVFAKEWRRAGHDELVQPAAKLKKKRVKKSGGRFLFWRW